MWILFFKALALMFVFEGLMPVVSPKKWRKLLKHMEDQSDHMVRNIGFVLMLLGVITMYALRVFN